MGWYAVARANGTISRWDATKQRAFPLDAAKQPR
jgi:hypothetical protein